MPMPDSKQLRAIKKLCTLLSGITPANGYDFDLTGRVFRGRSILTVDDAEDCLSILEFPRQEFTVPVGTGAVRNDQWQLMVQGWPRDDPENPSDSAYALKAAVEHRLSRIIAEKPDGRGPEFPEDYRLGRELTTFTILPGVVRPPEDGASRLAMFYMPIIAGIKVNMADPYAAD